MITVDVYGYTDEFGDEVEDFVVNDVALFYMNASENEEDRKETARRAAKGEFPFPVNANQHMDENAVLIATYTFEG